MEDRSQVRFAPLKRMILVGSYVIGKERIAVAIAQTLRTKIYAEPWKRKVMEAFDWPELKGLLTDNAHDSAVHIVPMSVLNKDGLCEYLDGYYPKYADQLIAIKPTGWTGLKAVTSTHDHRTADQRVRKQAITVHAVPYSEHSSFNELAALLAGLPVACVVPTVGNPGSAYLSPGGASAVATLLRWHQLQ